jgi:hypothetical protein
VTAEHRNKVIAFSGGRTSGRMLRLLLDQGGDYHVLFCNTGKERDETLDFVHEIETRWSVPVVWLEYTRVPASSIDPTVYPHKKSQKTIREQQEAGLSTHWFKIASYETARRRLEPNTPFDELLSWSNVLPNLRSRMCSVQMKVRTMMRWLFSQGIYEWTDHIGIRADEAHRALEIQAHAPKYRECVFPLIDEKVTELDIFAFWAAQSFDLQLKSYQGNCDLCYLKARWKRVKVTRENPQAVEWWERQEATFAARPGITGDGKFFRKGEPYAGIREAALEPLLFPDMNDVDIPCGCADKGFVISEDINCEI